MPVKQASVKSNISQSKIICIWIGLQLVLSPMLKQRQATMQFACSTLCPHRLHTITDNTRPPMQNHAPMCKTNPSTCQIESPARQGNVKPHCQNIVCNSSHPTPPIWACTQLETCSCKCNLEGPDK